MEQRQGLIHEGTGERVTTASVEIVFDNSDHRIVAVFICFLFIHSLFDVY